jgi:hypothetical protein
VVVEAAGTGTLQQEQQGVKAVHACPVRAYAWQHGSHSSCDGPVWMWPACRTSSSTGCSQCAVLLVLAVRQLCCVIFHAS